MNENDPSGRVREQMMYAEYGGGCQGRERPLGRAVLYGAVVLHELRFKLC